jgi:hypothetical protein
MRVDDAEAVGFGSGQNCAGLKVFYRRFSLRRCAAEYSVDKTCGGTLAGDFGELDGFVDGGVRRDAGKKAQLIKAEAQGDADFGVKALRAAQVTREKEIEQALPA